MKGAGAAPRTVGAWRGEIERRFRSARLHYGHGTRDARAEAAWLVGSALRIPFAQLDESASRLISPAAAGRLDALAGRRVRSREPLAYVLREAWLQGHRFHVDRRVIVPRSHLAGLMPEGLAAWLPRAGPRRILDLCTGSGCLAVLAALAWPGARVDASDLSGAALAVARQNVAAYRLRRRVRVLKSDLFGGLGEARYDLVLCNPPYVSAAAMRRLPPEYLHEPRMALAGGRDGLELVRRLIAQAPHHLAPRGLLAVEIGDGRAAFERAFPRLPVIWLTTAGGADPVFAVAREELLARPGSARTG